MQRRRRTLARLGRAATSILLAGCLSGCCFFDHSFTIRLVAVDFVPARTGRWENPEMWREEDWMLVEFESDISLAWLASFRQVQFRADAGTLVAPDELLFGELFVNGRDVDDLVRRGVAFEDPQHYVAWIRVDGASDPTRLVPRSGREFLRQPALQELRCRVVGVTMLLGGWYVSNDITIPAADLRRAVDEALAK